MPIPFTPKEFAHAVEMAKKAECKSYATLTAIKRMLSCKPIDVMDFIETHPELVHTEQRFETRTVKSRSLGLCVIEAYESEELNPWTEAGLQYLIKEHEHTVWISDINNYGQIIGSAIHEDTIPKDEWGIKKYKDGERPADARKATWLWRNTHEKLDAISRLQASYNKTFWMGGLGDSYAVKENFAINSNGIKILRDNGWTVIEPRHE